MKLITLTFLLTVVLISCQKNRYPLENVKMINISKDSLPIWLHVEKESNSKINGIVYSLSLDKNLILENPCKNGLLHGRVKTWYDNGHLELQMDYYIGQQDGLTKSWFENGQLQVKQNYKKGKTDGLLISYYENGQIEAIINRKNFQIEGILLNYYKNGQLKCEDNFLKNRRNGNSKHWYENGKLAYDIIYEQDSIISSNCWDDTGTKIECLK